MLGAANSWAAVCSSRPRLFCQAAPIITYKDVSFLELRFLRKLCDKSEANKAALMAIPRPIAQAWSEAGFNCLEMLFDGDKLVITPQRS
jgi:hypothetical protein